MIMEAIEISYDYGYGTYLCHATRFPEIQWCQLAAAHHMLAYHKIQETFLKQFALASGYLNNPAEGG